MMTKIRICFAGVMLMTASCAFANDFSLVKDGVSASCIVLPDNAGAVEKHAASELSTYLEKVTGAKVNIENTPSKELYNIYLGTTEAKNVSRSDTIDKAVSQLKDDGFVLAADKDGIRIISRKPVGVLYGTYEILKKYADIRWFAPGAEFEYCPKKPTIVVSEQITASNPSFKFRYVSFVCCNWNSKTIDTWDWMVRNGMTIRVWKILYNLYRDELEKRGAMIYDGGHCFSHLLSDKLFDTHPEYFPLIDGKRRKQNIEGVKRWPQPCTSNPKVAEIMAESLNKYLDSPPKGGNYLIGNNDDTLWCQCGNCTKIDPPEEKEKGLVSTRYYTLINKIAGGIYKIHPDADLWSWAYQNYQMPPTGVVPDKRLKIQACIHGRCYRHSMSDEKCEANAKFREMLSGWMKFGNPIITYEYDEWAGEPPYLPVENVICQDIKYYHKLGLVGFQLCPAPPDGVFGPKYKPIIKENWYAVWQMRYLVAQLAWDVNADYGRLVEDMGSKYYGKAWPVMKQYREQLIRMYEETPGHICIGTPGYILGKCLEKPGVETRFFQLLDEAEKAADGDQVAINRIKRDQQYFVMCWQTLHKEFLAKLQKELNVNKRVDKIVIDGKFEEADWNKADFTDDFITTDGKTAADPQTFVKMLYDENNIYFAVEAMEAEPGRMKIKTKEHDGNIFSDSSLEFFITAPGMNDNYVQIALNSKGVIYDSMVVSGSQDADIKFDSGIEVKTRVLADRWVVEIRVPAAPFGRKIGDGEVWKINVARNRRLVDGTSQSSSWCSGIFHGPDAFRSVVFGKTALLKNGDFEDLAEPKK